MDARTIEKVTRVHYVCASPKISAVTLTSEFTEYTRPYTRAFHAAAHGAGVLTGLAVTGTVGAVDLIVHPGVAVDTLGEVIILGTDGPAQVGPVPPLNRTSAPVLLATAAFADSTVVIAIQANESLRMIPVPPGGVDEFPCGKQDHAPWVRIVRVADFIPTDKDVVLALVVLGAGGVVTSIDANGGSLRDGRTQSALVAGRVRLDAPTAGGADLRNGPVGEVAARDGGGVHLRAFDPHSTRLDLADQKLIVSSGSGTIASLTPAGGGGGALQIHGSTGALTAELTSFSGQSGRLRLFGPAGVGAAIQPGSAVFDGTVRAKSTITTEGGVSAQTWLTSQAGGVQVNRGGNVSMTSSPNTEGGGFLQTYTKTNTPAVRLTTSGGGEQGFLALYGSGGTVTLNASDGIWAKGWITSGTGMQVNGPNHASWYATSNSDQAGYLQTQTKTNTPAVRLNSTAGGDAGWLGVYGSDGNPSVTLWPGGITTRGSLWTDGSIFAKNGLWAGAGWVQTDGGFQINRPGFTPMFAGADSDGGFVQVRTKQNKRAVSVSVASDGLDGWLGLFNRNEKVMVQMGPLTGAPHGYITIHDENGNKKIQIDGTGYKNFITPYPGDLGRQIAYASLEGPEAAAYVRGRAALRDGRATVEFPDHFALIVNSDTVTIQLTPRSAASKGLAIVRSDNAGFVVQELHEGNGSYEFDYFAAAVRSGFEKYQPVVKRDHGPMGSSIATGMPEPSANTRAAVATPDSRSEAASEAPRAEPAGDSAPSAGASANPAPRSGRQ